MGAKEGRVGRGKFPLKCNKLYMHKLYTFLSRIASFLSFQKKGPPNSFHFFINKRQESPKGKMGGGRGERVAELGGADGSKNPLF